MALEIFNILAIVAGVVLFALLFKAIRDRRDETPDVPSPVTPVELVPVSTTMKVANGKWSYDADMLSKLDDHKSGGDTNEPQDLACILFIALAMGSLPEAIICSANSKTMSTRVAQRLVNAFGFANQIKVLEGNESLGIGRSPGSEFLRDAAGRGAHVLTFGGPAGTLAAALKDGINKTNLRVIGILDNTSNARGATNEKVAKFVNDRIKIEDLGDPSRFGKWRQYEDILKMDFSDTPFKSGGQFIESNRDGNPLWDLACSKEVNANNRRFNQLQGYLTGPLRIADCLTVGRMFGLNTPTAVLSKIQHGMNLYKAGVANGSIVPDMSVPEDPPIRKRPPHTREGFDPSKVDTLGLPNPMSFREVGKIGRAVMHPEWLLCEYNARWESQEHSEGVIVNSNLSFGFKHEGKWYLVPIEYMRSAEDPTGAQDKKQVGWRDIEHKTGVPVRLQRGDECCFVEHTITRRGDLANGRERTELKWFKLS